MPQYEQNASRESTQTSAEQYAVAGNDSRITLSQKYLTTTTNSIHQFLNDGVASWADTQFLPFPKPCEQATKVPKIIINDRIKFFLKVQSAFCQFQTTTVSECCLKKLLPYILFEKCIYILALEMASPGNQHCAICIGTLSFSIFIDCCSC